MIQFDEQFFQIGWNHEQEFRSKPPKKKTDVLADFVIPLYALRIDDTNCMLKHLIDMYTAC